MTEEEELAALHKWEDEITENSLSEQALLYLAQIKDLKQQLDQELIKIQRLEMAIKGFGYALQEELEKGR